MKMVMFTMYYEKRLTSEAMLLYPIYVNKRLLNQKPYNANYNCLTAKLVGTARFELATP